MVTKLEGDTFLPSEIARLVLGYLKKSGCTKSYDVFFNESPDLREYAYLLRRGATFSTSIGGRDLKQMLQEYGSQFFGTPTGLESIAELHKKLNQIKKTIAKLEKPCARKASACCNKMSTSSCSISVCGDDSDSELDTTHSRIIPNLAILRKHLTNMEKTPLRQTPLHSHMRRSDLGWSDSGICVGAHALQVPSSSLPWADNSPCFEMPSSNEVHNHADASLNVVHTWDTNSISAGISDAKVHTAPVLAPISIGSTQFGKNDKICVPNVSDSNFKLPSDPFKSSDAANDRTANQVSCGVHNHCSIISNLHGVASDKDKNDFVTGKYGCQNIELDVQSEPPTFVNATAGTIESKTSFNIIQPSSAVQTTKSSFCIPSSEAVPPTRTMPPTQGTSLTRTIQPTQDVPLIQTSNRPFLQDQHDTIMSESAFSSVSTVNNDISVKNMESDNISVSQTGNDTVEEIFIQMYPSQDAAMNITEAVQVNAVPSNTEVFCETADVQCTKDSADMCSVTDTVTFEIEESLPTANSEASNAVEHDKETTQALLLQMIKSKDGASGDQSLQDSLTLLHHSLTEALEKSRASSTEQLTDLQSKALEQLTRLISKTNFTKCSTNSNVLDGKLNLRISDKSTQILRSTPKMPLNEDLKRVTSDERTPGKLSSSSAQATKFASQVCSSQHDEQDDEDKEEQKVTSKTKKRGMNTVMQLKKPRRVEAWKVDPRKDKRRFLGVVWNGSAFATSTPIIGESATLLVEESAHNSRGNSGTGKKIFVTTPEKDNEVFRDGADTSGPASTIDTQYLGLASLNDEFRNTDSNLAKSLPRSAKRDNCELLYKVSECDNYVRELNFNDDQERQLSRYDQEKKHVSFAMPLDKASQPAGPSMPSDFDFVFQSKMQRHVQGEESKAKLQFTPDQVILEKNTVCEGKSSSSGNETKIQFSPDHVVSQKRPTKSKVLKYSTNKKFHNSGLEKCKGKTKMSDFEEQVQVDICMRKFEVATNPVIPLDERMSTEIRGKGIKRHVTESQVVKDKQETEAAETLIVLAKAPVITPKKRNVSNILLTPLKAATGFTKTISHKLCDGLDSAEKINCDKIEVLPKMIEMQTAKHEISVNATVEPLSAGPIKVFSPVESKYVLSSNRSRLEKQCQKENGVISQVSNIPTVDSVELHSVHVKSMEPKHIRHNFDSLKKRKDMDKPRIIIANSSIIVGTTSKPDMRVASKPTAMEREKCQKKKQTAKLPVNTNVFKSSASHTLPEFSTSYEPSAKSYSSPGSSGGIETCTEDKNEKPLALKTEQEKISANQFGSPKRTSFLNKLLEQGMKTLSKMDASVVKKGTKHLLEGCVEKGPKPKKKSLIIDTCRPLIQLGCRTVPCKDP